MLNLLFRRLMADANRGASLFAAVTSIARQPHWYVEGMIPDTLDGRFALLSTVTAIVLVRLETEGQEGDIVSVALTERFIEAMEAEHRELGLGDPTLGKTVRKLVGSLARRTELWRDAADVRRAAEQSLYKAAPAPAALEHSTQRLGQLRDRLAATPLGKIAEGSIG